jgi:hypothetical protein
MKLRYFIAGSAAAYAVALVALYLRRPRDRQRRRERVRRMRHLLLLSRRFFTVTNAYTPHRRMTLAEIGSEWGEAEWTARDLWR